MATIAKMRQLEERQVEKEVDNMLWSPKMDILALQSKNGLEVSIYRINWQKLWSVSPPHEFSRSTCMAWRPDGKLLAVGYSSGHVAILDVESNEPLLIHETTGSVTCISWTLFSDNANLDPLEETQRDTLNAKQSDPSFTGEGWQFLTSFPSLSKSYNVSNETEDCQKLDDGNIVTMLTVGTSTAFIKLIMNGFLSLFDLEFGLLLERPVPLTNKLLSVSMSTKQFATFGVSYESQNEEGVKSIGFSTFTLPTIAGLLEELKVLTKFLCKFRGILDAVKINMTQANESIENINREVYKKLESYSKRHTKDSMAADFLDMLVFGDVSPEVENFLKKNVTEKGLKKLDQSIEVAHSNVQRLIVSQFDSVMQSLNFHLAELLGHIRAAENNFSLWGIKESQIYVAQKCAARFWANGVELQQIMETNLNSARIFMRWITAQIRRLSDMAVTDDLLKMSYDDMENVATFLLTLSNRSNQLVGQNTGTFIEETATSLFKPKQNFWYAFVNANPDLMCIPTIVSDSIPTGERRLPDFNELEEAVGQIYPSQQTPSPFSAVVRTDTMIPGFDNLNPPRKSSSVHFECQETGKIFCLVKNYSSDEKEDQQKCDQIIFVEFDPFSGVSRALRLALAAQTTREPLRLIDCQFYTSELFSVLVESGEHQRLIQVSYTLMEPHLKVLPSTSGLNTTEGLDTTLNIFDFADQSGHRDLERLLSDTFAVSGPRKVAAFLFRNRRRIRIYDMEAEEEDLDDDTLGTSGMSSDLNTSG